MHFRPYSNSYHALYCIIMFKFLYFYKIQKLKNHIASKTPYDNIEVRKEDEIKFKAFGKPRKIWMVIRHGTRFPNLRQVKKINAKLPLIRNEILKRYPHKSKNKLSKYELKLFHKITTKFCKSNCNKLTWLGKFEMKSLGKRMQKRFPEVLVKDFNKNIYQFRLTHTERTLESALYFACGLFGNGVLNKIIKEFQEDETLLRFYNFCTKWQKEIRHNPATLNENKLFQDSTIVSNAIRAINAKLGLKNLDFDGAEILFKTCVIETCKNKLSPWCLSFDINTIKIFEFNEDLKHYWLDGYGYETTYKQACPLFKDMMEFFHTSEDNPRVIVNFTHSGTFLKMLAHLQLYKDENPLKHDEFDISENRKWRLSKIGGFGSNLVFVLYKINKKYNVLILHQEKIIRLPCCPNSDLCDLEIIKEYYKSSLIDCSFNKICENISK